MGRACYGDRQASARLLLIGIVAVYGCRRRELPPKPIVERFVDNGILANPESKSKSAQVGVAISDMNGDGVPDFVTASPQKVKWFARTPSSKAPRYADQGIIGDPGSKHDGDLAGVGVAVQDIDGDGDPDVITASAQRLKLFENIGSAKKPHFADRGVVGNPQSKHAGSGVSVAIADIDRDGDFDLITASPQHIKLFRNTGSATKPEWSDEGVIGDPDSKYDGAGVGVALADVDADGNVDIITSSPQKVKLFLNKGSASSRQFSDLGVIGEPDSKYAGAGVGVSVGDVDGDGDLDIVTASPQRIKLFQNVGPAPQPRFADKGILGDPESRFDGAGVGVAMADLDNDGDLDLLVASTQAVKYFENKGP